MENPDVLLLRMHSPKREFTQMFIFKIQILKFVLSTKIVVADVINQAQSIHMMCLQKGMLH